MQAPVSSSRNGMATVLPLAGGAVKKSRINPFTENQRLPHPRCMREDALVLSNQLTAMSITRITKYLLNFWVCWMIIAAKDYHCDFDSIPGYTYSTPIAIPPLSKNLNAIC